MVPKDLLFPMFEFDFNWLEDVNNLFDVSGLQNFCNIIANQSPLVINLTLQSQFSQGVIKSCLERPLHDVDFLIYVCQFILCCLELLLLLSAFFLLLIPGSSKFPCLFPSLYCLHCVIFKPVKVETNTFVVLNSDIV